MVASSYAFQVSCSLQRPSVSPKEDAHSRASLSSSLRLKTFLKVFHQNPVFHNVERTAKEASLRLLDAFVDLAFEIVDQPLLPCQSNFAPVEEIGAAVLVTDAVTGTIPDDFTEGVYIRNGPNPLFGGLKSTTSIFGKSSHSWLEGEGMLHALHVFRDSISGRWKISYINRHVDTDTFKLEKKREKPAFLPAIEGDSAAVLSAHLLNWLRFGLVDKYHSNTNVFEHSRKVYSIAENYIPQEIDPFTLETKGNWDINRYWKRPFTSHPKKAPDTGELVVIGIHPRKPYFELGVVSGGSAAKKVLPLPRNRCNEKVVFVARNSSSSLRIELLPIINFFRYNVIMDFPLTIDVNRLITGGPLMKYNKEGYAQIGVMPRYGDSESVKWFRVEPNCMFHIINCYEHGDEVVALAITSSTSIIPGPDFGMNKFEWFSKRFKKIEQSEDESFFSRVYEWRLNMNTGEVTERNLTGMKYSMELPIINEKFIGIENKFGYAQVADLNASSTSGMTKYGGLAKLYFEGRKVELSNQHDGLIQVEYHMFPENTFCSGAAFVPKSGGHAEDDGWIITFVHDESTDKSQVYIVDATKFSEEPVAKISLPKRVPYGFHGAFVPLYAP
ncbi:carotenoid 9,10(9',10')-cleavage dioxygenase-like isoform X3 [Henckelia pumila]|uniref:carotenoid 9,10(9',10')-cleavage dioxygenase-like isoform X3 n=1 Tax=Henckelia pumila TaxID=405737 RepID=UPI003C6DF0A0